MVGCCSKEIDYSLGLKIITTLSSGFFSGGCAAMAFCTQPAIQDLDEKNSIVAMKSTLKRAYPMPLSLVIGTASGVGAYILSKRTAKDTEWLGAVIAFGSVLPYTKFIISPINGRFIKDEVDENEVKSLLTNWLYYHRFRTVATLGLFGYFTYILSTRK